MNETVGDLRNETCGSNEVIAPELQQLQPNNSVPEIPQTPTIQNIDKEKIIKVGEACNSKLISPEKCMEVKNPMTLNSSQSESQRFESISPFVLENDQPSSPSASLLNHNHRLSVLNSKDLEKSQFKLDKVNSNPSHQSGQIRVRKKSTEDHGGRKIRLPDKKQGKERTLKESGIPVGIAVAWQRNASIIETETSNFTRPPATESTTTAITPTLHRQKNHQHQPSPRLTTMSSTSPSKPKRSSSSNSKLKPTSTNFTPLVENESVVGNPNPSGKTRNHVTRADIGNSLETIDSGSAEKREDRLIPIPNSSTTTYATPPTSLVNEVLKVCSNATTSSTSTSSKSRLTMNGKQLLDSNAGNGYNYNNNFGFSGSSLYNHNQHRDWPPHLLMSHGISSGISPGTSPSPSPYMQPNNMNMHSQLPMQLMSHPYGPYSFPQYLYPSYSTNPLLHYEQLLQHQQQQQSGRQVEFDYRREITPISSPRISIPSPSPTSQLNNSSSFNLESHHPGWVSDLYHHQLSLGSSSATLSPRSLASSTPSPITIHDTNSYFLNRKCITPNPIPVSKHYPFSSPFSPSIKPMKDSSWKECSPISLVTHSRKPSFSPVAEEDGTLRENTLSEYEFPKKKQNDFSKLESLIEKRDDQGSISPAHPLSQSSVEKQQHRKRKVEHHSNDIYELKPKSKVQKLSKTTKCADKCDGSEIIVPETSTFNNNHLPITFTLPSNNNNNPIKANSESKDKEQEKLNNRKFKRDKLNIMPKTQNPSEIKNGKVETQKTFYCINNKKDLNLHNNSHHVPLSNNEICSNTSVAFINRPETEVSRNSSVSAVTQVQALLDASTAYNCDSDSNNKRANYSSPKQETGSSNASFLPKPLQSIVETASEPSGLAHAFPKIVISEEESHLSLLATVAQEIGPYISINSEASRTLRLENLNNMIQIRKSPERSVSNTDIPSNNSTITACNNTNPIPVCNTKDNNNIEYKTKRKLDGKPTEQRQKEQSFQLKIPQLHVRNKGKKEGPKRRLSLEKKPKKASERRNSLDEKKSKGLEKTVTNHRNPTTSASPIKLKPTKKHIFKKTEDSDHHTIKSEYATTPNNSKTLSENEKGKVESSVYDFDFEDVKPSVPPFKQYSSEKFVQNHNNTFTSNLQTNTSHLPSNLSHPKLDSSMKTVGRSKKSESIINIGSKDLKESFIPRTSDKLQNESSNLNRIITKPISKVKPTRILTHPNPSNQQHNLTTLGVTLTPFRQSKVERSKGVIVPTNGISPAVQKMNNEQTQKKSQTASQSNLCRIFSTPSNIHSVASNYVMNPSFQNTDSNTSIMSNDSCTQSTWNANPILAVTAVKVEKVTDLNKCEVPVEQSTSNKPKDSLHKSPRKSQSFQHKSSKSSSAPTSGIDEEKVNRKRVRNRSEGSSSKSPLKIRKRQTSVHHIKPSLKAETVVKSTDEDSDAEDLLLELSQPTTTTPTSGSNKAEKLKIRKPSIDMNIFSRRHKSTDEKDDQTKELEWNDNVVISGVDEMIDEMRILTEIQGLFYTGKLNALQPPDVYGVTLDNERGAPPHMIFSAEQVLEKCSREAKPWKPSQLPHGLRICAYWSPMYSGLYAGKVSTDYDTKSELVPVEFDDGDTGVIKIAEIRLLAPNHPVREYDPNPLLTLEKKHRKRRNSSANTQNSCDGDHEEPDCGEAYCAKIAKLQEDEDETEEEVEGLQDDYSNPKFRYWAWSGLGYKPPKSKKNRNKEFFHGIQRGDEIINVGDSAIFISNERSERPFLGRVENFWEKKGHKIVNVRWFYHPEEVKTKKKIQGIKYPGALFESPHIDENDVQTIARKCEVLQYDEFKQRYGHFYNGKVGKLQGSQKKSQVKGVYYVAGFYDPYNFKLKMNDLK